VRVKLRPGTVEDAPICGTICYRAFAGIAAHHNFPSDFPEPEVAVNLLASLLSRADIYSVVAERDGKIIGSNFLWTTVPIAGIGPFTIEPSAQGSGIGRLLLEDVLNRARGQNFSGYRLVQAAYNTRSLSLYTKFGFCAREPLSVLQGPAVGQEIPGYAVRRAAQSDLTACNSICRSVHGHTRSQELLYAIRQATATVVMHSGRITGYATLIGFHGHAVGEKNDALKALIAAASAFQGPGFIVPTRNSELLRWCLEKGLRVVQPLTLMSLGLYNEPAGSFLPSILY